MFKVWVTESGFRLTLLVSYCSRLILTKGDRTVLSKQYDWDNARRAEQEAEALAELGSMKLEESRVYA